MKGKGLGVRSCNHTFDLTARSNGMRRPVAVLKGCFFHGSVASFKLSERRAPYHNVRGFYAIQRNAWNNWGQSKLKSTEIIINLL